MVRRKLPSIAAFPPSSRDTAIAEVERYLKPGAQKTKGMGGGLLPALGIMLHDERLCLRAEVLPSPMMTAAGIKIPPEKAKNWGPYIDRATFRVEANQATSLNPVIVHHNSIDWKPVYKRLVESVNNYSSKFRFPTDPYSVVQAGDNDQHWGAVQDYFKNRYSKTNNVFVLDFTRPRSALDPAYSTVKHMLSEGGYLSQFVNFRNCEHARPKDDKERRRSHLVLISIARQILHKCGFTIWWVTIPKSLPLPSVFVGVDVFHSPRAYDPKTKTKTGRSSCAAIVIKVVQSHDSPEVGYYSQTYKRESGQEYELGSAIEEAVGNAVRFIGVEPRSCVVWRDGVSDVSVSNALQQELPGLKRALSARTQRGEEGGGKVAKMDVPVAFMYCQKRIATKMFFRSPDGNVFGMPAGSYMDGLEDARHSSFYINGVSPPVSTPKPVRYIIAHHDKDIGDVSLAELSWAMCHGYANWPGPIKVPSVCQMAHKLAEFAGGMRDCGESIDHKGFTNTLHFL